MTLEITFRTLKGGTFKLPAAPTDTILDLKKKVASQQNIDQYPAIRLIFKGKILTDEATVSSAGISSSGFIVVMPPKKTLSKPAPAPDPAPSTAAASQPAASAPVTIATPAPATPRTAPVPAAASDPTATAPDAATDNNTSAPPASTTSPDDANSLVTGAAYEQSVSQIVEMGFPEADVKRALRAAFNNPQRAVDYLFNGIPESVAAATAEPPANPTPASGNALAQAAEPGTTQPGTPFNMFAPPTQGATGGGGTAGAQPGNLDFFRTLPRFNMMRRLIQSNPAMLPQLLQQLEETNPSLLAMIEANQEEFTRLINEPVQDDDVAGDDVMERLANAMAGAGAAPPEQGHVYVTEEEHEQIIRLSELGATIGLEESHVVETWLACGKDEAAAANYLVDHAEELRADSRANNDNRTNPPDAPDNADGGPPA